MNVGDGAQYFLRHTVIINFYCGHANGEITNIDTNNVLGWRSSHDNSYEVEKTDARGAYAGLEHSTSETS